MSDVTPLPDHTYTVDEFCTAERVSRVQLYEFWKRSKGPRFYFNGRCRRITHQARLDWQREREAEASQEMQGA
jgi:hypothetical protein